MRDQRTKLKQQRRSLDPGQIRDAALQINALARHLPEFARRRRIAFYIAVAGEADCEWLIHDAWLRKCAVFVPILSDRCLKFAPLTPDTTLRENRYGIPEPTYQLKHLVRPRDLDVVVVPLVAFDTKGNRLGMGAGYYDRSFSFLATRSVWRHPKLIGVAYEFQRVRHLKAQPWDIPLDAVISEKRIYRFS